MKKTKYRILIAFILLAIVLIRIYFWEDLEDKFDKTTLSLLLVSLILLLIPIENIKSLKAGGIELELNHPQIKGAINSLDLNVADNKKIEQYVNSISESGKKSIAGSKVLWIDDKPASIIGERRLFRALGLNITAAGSLEEIKRITREDNDFDLIISDIQWRDKENPNKVTYGGIEAVQFLRKELNDKVINSTNVIFYTAYTVSQTTTIENQTGFKQIENHSLCHTILSLLEASVIRIAECRQNPIIINSRKKAT